MHRLISKFQLKLCPSIRKQKPQKRLNVKACKDAATQEDLQRKITDLLQHSRPTDDSVPAVTDSPSLTDEWCSLSSSIMKAATESLGLSSRKHQDWFDDQRSEFLRLLQEKNKAHDEVLRNPHCANLFCRWKKNYTARCNGNFVTQKLVDKES